MVAVMLIQINIIMALCIIKVYVIVAISWLPLLVSELFHPGY